MSLVMTILGLSGAALMTAMYWLLQRGSISANNVKFYALNGLGALLITISITYDFDLADLGGIAVEIAWITVSLMGILRVIRTKST